MKSHISSLLTVFFAFLPSLAAVPQDRITHPIDPGHTVSLSQSVRPEAVPANDRGPVDPALAIDGVTLVMPPSAAQQSALNAFLEAQRNPSSTDFQHWLTPEEFADRFGASQNDINAVTAWLRGQGLSVNQTARGRNFVVVSGTAAQMSSAFGAGIHYFESNGARHYANSVPPSIPAALSGVVTQIRGLDDFKPSPKLAKLSRFKPDYTSSSGAHYLAPDDYAVIYDVARLYQAGIDGTGQKVAVVGQTDFSNADIQAFRTQFNLPSNTPQVILTGRDPGTDTGDEQEAELDLEWIGAVARNATILYVNSRNVFTSVQYAIDQNVAPVISMSYGECETQSSASMESLAQQANAEGITWVGASGDSGAAGCESSNAKVASHGLAVNLPTSIPEVTGIGGTTFNEGTGTYWGTPTANGASALSYIPEVAWNDTATDNELSASGGGASILFSKPSWQSGTGVPGDGARDVPDLAFSASADHDGYLVYFKGGMASAGGTSAPTPSFAGVLGLLNQYLLKNGKITQAGLGNINPTLYHLAQTTTGVFNDITSGNNIVPCEIGTKDCTNGSLGYSAGVGYDQVTGLGSADIYQLVTNWAGVVSSGSTTTSLTANPASIAESSSTQLTATVRAASGTTVPSGTVTFSSGTKTFGTSALTTSGSAGTAGLTVAASSLAVGANTVVATYTGNASFAGSSASTVVTVTAPTTGSDVVPSVSPNPVTRTGNSWEFTITLNETAGQATTLNSFTVNGTSYSREVRSFFGTNQIAANGTVSAALRMTGVTPPANVVFGFAGTDSSGREWSASITVPFD